MKIRFHDQAKAELDAAVDWLEQRRVGLGGEFLAGIQRLLISIQENPLQFGPIPGSRFADQMRVGLITRFRYSMFFRVIAEQSIIRILAVQHGSRNLLNWRERLESLDLDNE